MPSRTREAISLYAELSNTRSINESISHLTQSDFDELGAVTPAQVARFAAEAKKGLPIVLCLHVPLFTDGLVRTQAHFWDWRRPKFRSAAVVHGEVPECVRQRDDPTTRDFIAYLKEEPLLKAILAGHLHFTAEERFSSTAMQYVVGGNFMFHGREVLFV